MELTKLVYIFGLVLACDGQTIFGSDSCMGALFMENAEFQACFANLAPFIGTMLTPMSDSSQTNQTAHGEAMMKAICSDGVRQAYTCMLNFMAQCPGEQSGVDINLGNNFLGVEGIDLACSLYAGACQSVLACFPNASISTLIDGNLDTDIMYASTMATPLTATPIPPVTFHRLVPVLCGDLKPMYDCAISRFAQCAPGGSMDAIIPAILGGLLASTNVTDMSLMGDQLDYFMHHECNEEAFLFERNGCVGDKLMSPEYSDCYESAMQTFQNGTDNCPLFFILSQCTTDHVGDDCGSSASEFLVGNIPTYTKGISRSCIVSGVMVTGHAHNTLVTFAVALVLCVFTVDLNI